METEEYEVVFMRLGGANTDSSNEFPAPADFPPDVVVTPKLWMPHKAFQAEMQRLGYRVPEPAYCGDNWYETLIEKDKRRWHGFLKFIPERKSPIR
jgi:hypothetical protein